MCSIPFLRFIIATPSAKQGKAHFAAIVEVRIEANSAIAGCDELHFWRRLREVGIQKEVEFEASTLVWSAFRAGNQNLNY